MGGFRDGHTLSAHRRAGETAGWRTFDNANPRDPEFYKSGIRARALGAHLNGIETFPFFAVAVLLAEFRHGPQYCIDLLAVAFVMVRLAFVAAYLGNWPTTRTLLWNLGFLCQHCHLFYAVVGTSSGPFLIPNCTATDDGVIWRTIHENLPALRARVAALLDEMGEA